MQHVDLMFPQQIFMRVYFACSSADLSELAKAAKKKLQSVSVELFYFLVPLC